MAVDPVNRHRAQAKRPLAVAVVGTLLCERRRCARGANRRHGRNEAKLGQRQRVAEEYISKHELILYCGELRENIVVLQPGELLDTGSATSITAVGRSRSVPTGHTCDTRY